MSFRSSRYRPYRNSLRSKFIGNQRAADQQRDTTTVVINTNTRLECGQTKYAIFPGTTANVFVDSGCAAVNIYEVLCRSEYFRTFSKMYDQVKIDEIRAKIVATNWYANGNQQNSDANGVNEYATARSYVVVTAWDRSGLSEDQAIWLAPFGQDGTDIEDQKFWITIARNITTYSSAMTKHLGPGNAYEIVRKLYPNSLNERDRYVNTEDLKPQQTRTNSTSGFAYRTWRYVKEDPNGDNSQSNRKAVSYEFNEKYPTNLFEDPTCPFKPTLLINVISGSEPSVVTVEEPDPDGFIEVKDYTVNKVRAVAFNIEFDIAVTFRGLRCNKVI